MLFLEVGRIIQLNLITLPLGVSIGVFLVQPILRPSGKTEATTYLRPSAARTHDVFPWAE
jgi:hypothetical protein